MKQNIDIFCPMESEYSAINKAIYRHINEIGNGDKDITTHLLGVGKVNSALKTIMTLKRVKSEPPFYPERKALLFGCAGSIGLPYGSLITITRTCQSDYDTSLIGDKPFSPKWDFGESTAVLRSGDCLYLTNIASEQSSITQDKFFTSEQIPTTIEAKDFPLPDAKVADMEDYSFAMACSVSGTPWAILRVISDDITQDEEGTHYDSEETPLFEVLDSAAESLIKHICSL